MAAQIIFLFGDQADAPIPMIRRVIEKSRNSKNLKAFLQNAVDTVQLEVAKLTPSERETVGSFHNIHDLVEGYKNKSDRYGIAQMVLVFVTRIGELLLHVESNPSLLLSEGNSPQILALGICGGLLPAAAAAVARNASELIEAGSYLAGVSCRVAVAIARRSMQIEAGEGSWAFSALGKIVAQLPSILDRFHREKLIPRHRQAYIAVNANTWATVFGPPSVLKLLIEFSAALRQSDITILPAFGAVHAAHMALPDLTEIVGNNPLLEKEIKPTYKIISGSRYIPIVASNLGDLLQECLLDIFQKPTNPARLFEVARSFFNKSKEVSLYMLGSTSYLLLLRRSLDSQGFKVCLLTNAPSLQNFEVRGGSGSVAIIGMSGRFPGTESVDEMWESIMQQTEFHKKIPTNRFDVDAYMDETGQSKTAITTPYGCFLENPGLFDHKMFNVSPREAIQMDPGQRLLMHATYEALEHAGITTNGSVSTDSKQIRTFIGDGSDDWKELQQTLGVDKYVIQGTQRAFTPGRLNHHFKWEGATYSVDSACGSTASAVGLAYTSLVNRECDTAIAGGSNIIATPFWHSALSKGGFLSQTGGCKTFRGDADGYCRGEAIGVIVLKRLEDAIQDNDNIISVIRGYARNHSAETVSITRPHRQTQERLYRNVLNKAGLEPHQISYAEMHGTGTTAGDSAELESVVNVFATKGSRESPLLVGSIKANIGHSEAASGICSLIKAAMIFQQEVVPPQVGIPQYLGKFACLDEAPIVIPGKPMTFSRQSVGQKRNILVNNFDAAGGNSCFILEEPSFLQRKRADPREYHVVTCSGHTSASFDGNKRQLLQFLTENKATNLANLAYTTTSRRIHHSLRTAYCGKSIQSIVDALSKDLKETIHEAVHQKEKRSIVFLFTGQGAHYAGMGADFFNSSPPFRATVENLQRVCTTHGFPSFVNLISDQKANMNSVTTVQLHLALVALQLALVDLWKMWGIEPDVVMGHSIGEYAALYAAGVLSANDVMYLTGKRAELIQNKLDAGTHGMLSISGTPEEISGLLSTVNLAPCEVSCMNSPGMVVISGERTDLLRLQDRFKEKQIKCKLLDVAYAMHSRQTDSLLPEFRQLLRGVQFNPPKVKIVSTLLGDLVEEDGIFGIEYVVRHTREAVNFEKAVSNLISRQLADFKALWVEVGPTPICLGLLRSNIKAPSSNFLSSFKNGESNWKTASMVLAACYQAHKPVLWREYHQDFTSNLSHITLPRYAFDTRDFWLTYSDKSPQLEKNDTFNGRGRELHPNSTCLHRLLKQKNVEQQQSASFTTEISRPSLLKLIEGHKLSGIAICPAGVFTDMALTAVRYLLTDGDSIATYPSLTVLNTQIDHPVVPTPESEKVVLVEVHREKHESDIFEISFTDHIMPSSPTIAKCNVRVRDHGAFEAEKTILLSLIQPKISNLTKDVATGNANRFNGNVFYKLFSHLMNYSSHYKGVEDAIINNEFTEGVATIKLPHHDDTNSDEKYTLSPYWIDALTHLAGFLLNGNPTNSSGDYVYIGTHIERMEIDARQFSPDIRYQSYAYIEKPNGGENYRGNVYLLHEGSIIGILQGARFHRMPRKALHHILGKVDPPKSVVNGQENNSNFTQRMAQLNGNGYHRTTESNISHSSNGTDDTNGNKVSVVPTFVALLLEETGMSEIELTPTTSFSEIGVDSLMSLSIFAALKSETGLELGASFINEYPTLGEAQRALRIAESRNSDTKKVDDHFVKNGYQNGVVHDVRTCNIALLQGPSDSPSRSPLFLIADGAGSAAAYLQLPRIEADLSVFAVESPWVQDPENFTASFSEVVSIYKAAICAKQAHGPYLLGGWSAGGVFAYEVARLLLEAGEKVSGLIIIDISGPRRVDRTKVAQPTLDVINQIGMLTGIERSYDEESVQAKRLKRHMLSTVTCFSKLDPIPMTIGRRPDNTFIVWAKKDIFQRDKTETNGPSATSLDAWYYVSSREAGANGWDVLIGDSLEIFQIEGDHFSIMTTPEVIPLGKIIQDAVAKCR